MRLGGGAVGVERRLVVAGELRQVAGVAAQRRREHRRRGRPERAGAVGREAPLADPDQEDRGPLQALGPVDREQLDRVGLGRGRDVEAVAGVVLGGEVGQQRRQRDVAVDGVEVGDRLDEEVEVVAPGGGRRADRRGQLDVDAGGVHDPAHQVEQRLARRGGAGSAARRRAARTARAPRSSRRPSPGSATASSRAGISAGSTPSAISTSWSVIVAGRRRGPLAPGELLGAPAEQPQVARADRPARPGEQGEQRGVGGDVVQQVQGGDDLGDLGQAQQPGEPDDLDRDAGRAERVEDVGGVRVVAGEHADVGPAARPAALVRRTHRLDQRGQLVGVGEVDGGRRRRPRRRLSAASSGATWS